MHWRWLAGLAFVACVGSAAAQPSKGPAQTPEAQRPPVWQSLERFSSEQEFMRYVASVRRAGARDEYATGAYNDAVPAPPPPPPPPPAVAGAVAEFAAPAAQRAADVSVPQGESVTNVQTQGVDEGGIVKQIGRFLIVLQDGRLFVTDTRPGGEPGLTLTSRMNVYRSPGHQMWYDEMLTSGNRILVTGYSYRDQASEISIFTLNDEGQLAREAVYYISSNDYYDTENYATRLVNGNLVIYTPLDVRSVNPTRPMQWPLIRRWIRDGDQRAVTTSGRPLFDARDIYKPLRTTYAPMVHSVSVCPLGDLRSGDEFECRTTAFVGQQQREFFVSTNDIYLWVTPGWADCYDRAAQTELASQATLYQVPLDGATPRVAFTRGQPINQFALDAAGGEFRALVDVNAGACQGGGARPSGVDLRYFHMPLDGLAVTPHEAPQNAYVRTPDPGSSQYEPRFTSDYLVYGARPSHSSYPPQGQTVTGRVVAVPLTRPTQPTVLEAPHGVLRIERAGGDIVLTGYRSEEGLSVSLLDLGAARPRIVDTRVLRGRYESENRSHAFNALVGQDGNGLMGLPTVQRVKEGGRWFFRSQASDLSFLSVASDGALGDIGALRATPNAQDPSYRCEVSCIDWYGNSRAIFTGGRVFALSATEVIEGGLENGRMTERRRLNLSRPPPRVEASYPTR
ncbi:beta-propeller domain-containing protein [Terricaulis sp.]|uniref:beta-propeller domain-containing protein n=1 Tax=Terricaulis sp. TaxID=2768686 RepID=UPI0037846DC4